MDEYSIDDIKRILAKIENTKDKSHRKKIKDIIFKENPDLSTTKKSSGVLFFFHNLTQSTYKKLDQYFKKIELEKLEQLSASINNTDDINNNETERSEKSNMEEYMKLTNVEKRIIKKIEYYNQISENNDSDIYVSSDNKVSLKNKKKC
jgi:hypothetical protein